MLHAQGREEEVIILLDEAVSLLENTGDMEALIILLGRLAETLASTGQFSLTLRRAEEVWGLCEERGYEEGLMLCDMLIERLTPHKEEEEAKKRRMI